MSIGRHVGLAARFAVCFVALTAVPHAAHAQADKGPTKAERASAREAYDNGTKAFDRGDYAAALDGFVKANALIPSVQAMFWIAQAQDKLGHTDAAIEAYEAITARADFTKLSPEKSVTVNTRLAALKAEAAAPAAAPAPAEPAPDEFPAAAEGPPPVAAMPLPPTSEPLSPPVDDSADVLPKKNTAELGVLFGALFVSGANGLHNGAKHPAKYDATWELGARAAFFPEKIFGVEAEWAHGFSHTKTSSFAPRSSASFDSVRGHLIGQYPTSRFVPFALLGAGMIHEKSDAAGADTDFMLEVGVGLKVMATKLLVPRLDVRGNMTQKKGGGFTDGIAFHPEILLGLSFTLGR
jgi:hypothetical protein